MIGLATCGTLVEECTMLVGATSGLVPKNANSWSAMGNEGATGIATTLGGKKGLLAAGRGS